MNVRPLVKTLLRYSWVSSILILVYTYIFLYVFRLSKRPWLGVSILTGIRFFMLCLISIVVLVFIQRLMPARSERFKKITGYVCGYALALIFCLCVRPIEAYVAGPRVDGEVQVGAFPATFWQMILNYSMILIIHNLVIFRYLKESSDLENARLRSANLESTNLLLRQQIHPHFLFNALSMLKSLYKTDVRAGEAYLSHLVNFMRASLAEHQSTVSRLSDEIKLCHDYLEMQQIRFEDALKCSIDIPDEVLRKGVVPPFSIQSLIENAIKHNEVTDLSPLVIRVFCDNGHIVVENNLQVKKNVDAPSGKGLINLIERYRILSGEDVVIRQDEETFSVIIKVLPDENSDHRR